LNKILTKGEKSPLIVAIDVEPKIGLKNLLSEAKEFVSGIKIGLPYLLTHGMMYVKEMIKPFIDDYFFIADLKLADIGFVCKLLLEKTHLMGFDAVISHGFIGLQDALAEIKKKTDELGLFLFIVAAMSHRGAEDILNKNIMKILEISKILGIEGFVAPATMPNYIKVIRKELGDRVIIISPGVSTQGASVGDALKAGANFEIIGRKIILSENPLESLRKINELYKDVRKR